MDLNLKENKWIQFGAESLLIVIVVYMLYAFFPKLPWWSIVFVCAIVAFGMNTKVPSFATGFSGIAILWGYLAYQKSSLNMDVLATKVGQMFSVGEFLQNMGGLTALQMVYITGFIGGIIGGMAAMTGALGRKAMVSKVIIVEEKPELS